MDGGDVKASSNCPCSVHTWSQAHWSHCESFLWRQWASDQVLSNFLKTSDKSKPFPLEWDRSHPLVKTISFPNTALIPESCQLNFYFYQKLHFLKKQEAYFLLIFHLLAAKLFLFKLSKISQLGRPDLQPKMGNILESCDDLKKPFLKWKLRADLTITVNAFYVVRGHPYTLQPVDSSRSFSLIKCMTL